jgi:hypothetical protein
MIIPWSGGPGGGAGGPGEEEEDSTMVPLGGEGSADGSSQAPFGPLARARRRRRRTPSSLLLPLPLSRSLPTARPPACVPPQSL